MDLKNINLMNDALFKAFMCHQNNRELVVDFLHSVTGIEKEILRKGVFIGGEEIPKRRISTKKQMTDFAIKLENKQRIIIEMTLPLAETNGYHCKKTQPIIQKSHR